MYTADDLIDCILEMLAAPPAPRGTPPAAGAPAGAAPAAGGSRWEERPVRGRPFLSERDVRKALTPGASQLTIPSNAILSPLALDWLALKGIRILREG